MEIPRLKAGESKAEMARMSAARVITEDDRQACEAEIRNAEMPAGSVFYWLGSTLHGAGANTSSDWRYGIILAYSLGWVRQEENQYLDVPPHIAEQLSPELRQMIGYNMYRALGFSVGNAEELVST